jgi:branched-chain amino acid aminotransferase
LKHIFGTKQDTIFANEAPQFAALRFGNSIFETMLLRNGQLQFPDLHIQRLHKSLQLLQWESPFAGGEMLPENIIAKLASENGCLLLARVRLHVFPLGNGIYGTGSDTSGFLLECTPLAEANTVWNESGLLLGLSTGATKSTDSFANLKSGSCLVYATAKKQATSLGWDDAIIVNSHGRLAETTTANLFWVKSSKVHTPPLSEGCVAGTTRLRVMQRFDVKELPLTEAELQGADEVFVTNAVKGVNWVRAIGTSTYSHQVVKEIAYSLHI